MKYINKPVLIIVMALISTMINAQQIYRWTDASGKIHYTDDLAIATQNKAKSITKPTATKVNSSTTLTDEARAQLEEQQLNQARLQQVNSQRQLAFKQHCKKLEEQLAYLKSISRLTDGRNKDGSFRIMSDQEKNQFIADKEANYKRTCNN